MNWYKRASQTLRYTNFYKAPIRWTSMDNPPHDVIIDMIGDKNTAELFLFVNNIDFKTIGSAKAELFIDLGEDFIVDDDHSIRMNFTLKFELSRREGGIDQLSGSVEIPWKYVPEFKNEFRNRKDDLFVLDIKLDELSLPPPPAVELRRKWKPWK